MNAPEKYFDNVAVANPPEQFECDFLHGIDPIAYAKFVAEAVAVETNADFVQLAKGALREVFPHEMLLAGIGHAQADGIRVYHAIGVDYPQSYLHKLREPAGFAGPVLTQWLRTREPQLLDVESATLPPRWREKMLQQNFRNIAAHGMRDINGSGATYFTFSKIPGMLSEKHRLRLKAITPILHQALLATWAHISMTIQQQRRSQPNDLTDRQVEILHWVAQGKANGEIAQILELSEHTVKNHLKQVLQKLGATNRVQAAKVFVNLNVNNPHQQLAFNRA
jgi:LuxR family transcriptional regulator, quorum-sensing system regulator CviR